MINNQQITALPYWRLSSFYFFYFALLGGIAPYWSLYLESLGFDPKAIGLLLATLMATKIIAPNVWGWLADHKGGRLRIVRLGAFCTILIFLAVLGQAHFWVLLFTMMGFGFFWNAILSQYEVITLSHLVANEQRYSHIRLWGSIGFIGSVMTLGFILDWQPMTVLPWVLLGIMVCLWVSTLLTTYTPAIITHHHYDIKFTAILMRPPILVFFIVCFLMQLSHGPYYTFYSILMEDYGYSKTFIGALWAIGVAAEVVVFLLMPRLLSIVSVRSIILISLLFAVIRWWLIGSFPDQISLMIIAQLFHAATFGSFHAAAISFVHSHFDSRHEGKGQAMYSSVSFGAGGALGALLSGYAWENIGPQMTYWIAAVVSLLALGLAWRYIMVANDKL